MNKPNVTRLSFHEIRNNGRPERPLILVQQLDVAESPRGSCLAISACGASVELDADELLALHDIIREYFGPDYFGE